MKKAPNITVAACPDCGEKITLKGKVEYGRRVACPNCEAELKVVEANPVELDWVDGDYYDDDDQEDEDW